jgi:hypothetical protein
LQELLFILAMNMHNVQAAAYRISRGGKNTWCVKVNDAFAPEFQRQPHPQIARQRPKWIRGRQQVPGVAIHSNSVTRQFLLGRPLRGDQRCDLAPVSSQAARNRNRDSRRPSHVLRRQHVSNIAATRQARRYRLVGHRTKHLSSNDLRITYGNKTPRMQVVAMTAKSIIFKYSATSLEGHRWMEFNFESVNFCEPR